MTALLLSGVLAAAQGPALPRFLADDPLTQDPETQDASGAKFVDIELAPDLLLNLFTKPGDATPNVRAGNVNTIDEVPDSGWFTNRIYARPLSAAEIVRGPNQSPPPAPGPWTIVSAKTSGVSPGFTARDSRGVRWFVQFDTAGHPRAATSAVPVAMRLFWALGYNQVETHLVKLRPDEVLIDDKTTIETRATHRRPMRRSDVDDVLARAARDADGSYRATAGLAVPGRVIGPFKYYGTRADDPNDLVPHEHRRELRALKVFGAWTNLVDMKAGNTLDTVVDEAGPRRRAALPAGRRVDVRRRRPGSTRVGRRLRVPLRRHAAVETAGELRLLREALADHPVSGAARGRPVRRRPLRSRGVAAASTHGARSRAPTTGTRSGRRCAWPPFPTT